MISLLCQKSTSGVISTSQDGQSRNYINELLNDSVTTNKSKNHHNNNNNNDDVSIRSFDEDSRSEVVRRMGAKQQDLTSQSKSIKSAAISIASSSRVPTANNNNKTRVGTSSNRSVSFDPTLATQEYYRQHPFRRLSNKKLRSVQNWINQKLSEDPANLDYYVNIFNKIFIFKK